MKMDFLKCVEINNFESVGYLAKPNENNLQWSNILTK